MPHLVSITASKFLPTRRIVSEPLPQRGTGRNILEPLIDGRCFLCHATGPKPVDQYPNPVASNGRFIRSLQSYIGRDNPFAHLSRSLYQAVSAASLRIALPSDSIASSARRLSWSLKIGVI